MRKSRWLKSIQMRVVYVKRELTAGNDCPLGFLRVASGFQLERNKLAVPMGCHYVGRECTCSRRSATPGKSMRPLLITSVSKRVTSACVENYEIESI